AVTHFLIPNLWKYSLQNGRYRTVILNDRIRFGGFDFQIKLKRLALYRIASLTININLLITMFHLDIGKRQLKGRVHVIKVARHALGFGNAEKSWHDRD